LVCKIYFGRDGDGLKPPTSFGAKQSFLGPHRLEQRGVDGFTAFVSPACYYQRYMGNPFRRYYIWVRLKIPENRELAVVIHFWESQLDW